MYNAQARIQRLAIYYPNAFPKFPSDITQTPTSLTDYTSSIRGSVIANEFSNTSISITRTVSFCDAHQTTDVEAVSICNHFFLSVYIIPSLWSVDLMAGSHDSPSTLCVGQSFSVY